MRLLFCLGLPDAVEILRIDNGWAWIQKADGTEGWILCYIATSC